MLITTCSYLQGGKQQSLLLLLSLVFKVVLKFSVFFNKKDLLIREGLISSQFTLISVELILVHLHINWIEVEVNNSAFSCFGIMHRYINDHKNYSVKCLQWWTQWCNLTKISHVTQKKLVKIMYEDLFALKGK